MNTLKYGENPHQSAAFYREPNPVAGSIAAYEGQHFVKVTLAGPGELIDRATYCYFATVQGEAGANAIAGLVCNGALVTTDVAILDEAV